MQVEGGELQSALQYQVLSTGLQHGHLVLVGGVQHQQCSMLQLEKQVSVACFHFNAYTICVCLNRHTCQALPNTVHADGVSDHEYALLTVITLSLNVSATYIISRVRASVFKSLKYSQTNLS